MNTATDINQTPIITKIQTIEKVTSADLEPILFCAEVTSSQQHVSPKTVIANSQTVEKVTGADLEPIPFCAEVTSSQQHVSAETELTVNTQMVAIVRIPCRARGVCDTHTPSSAFFEIPEDCQHGKLLSCSHKLCRDSGRRFRYCKECDQVTAKRNFTKRHAHAISKTFFLSPNDFTVADSSIGSTCKKRKVSLDADNVSTLAMSTGDDGISDTPESVPSTIYANKRENSNDDLSGSIIRMVTPKEADILEILRRRPTTDDGLATSQWIQDLLDITSNEATNQEIMAEELILTDDEDDERLVCMEPLMRMQSLDKFEMFTQSFENLLMK